ncbi:disease resistance protein RUN1-like [Eucalyptus grandis]|uniref:disease resistance protein RUN1-like n=1 Tax=Eucalyptus grandis TaxID=71139 RepID=UPI00192EA530|nr:disease resistance protein RUN1-like [Eucalyptus grandis]
MEDVKRERAAEASSSTGSKRQRREELMELPLDGRDSRSPLLPSLDSAEKINVPSESRENSGPSASYTSVIENNYYVFLSFRGPDTRKGFVDHLYHKLVDVGLPFHPNFVFRDDENLRLGEPIAENLLSAIKRSKVSIPVISENYAASEWCLREIIQIMECVESGKQKVYPVLYKVTTGDVRDMRGKFGDAFRCHNYTFDKEVERKGREALKEAVERKIVESEKFASGCEGELVKGLVEIIMRNQQHDFLPSLPKDLIGIDDHVARVINLADTQTMKSANTASSETQNIVIYGIGGIGKTTLVTTIYKKLSNKFPYRSFLKDIRETIKSKGMKYVQSLLISNLTKRSDHSERDSGIEMIQLSCDKKKVLIVLDDVDRQDHLDNLIGGCNFESGSWIIITCRDKALLKSEYKGYELKEMDSKDSLLLFCKNAFRGEEPPTKLMALSRAIIDTIGRLPLALVIIGSFLRRKDKSIWTETLEKLRKVPHMDVQQKLRTSYDSLEYQEQQMFLDIACFFIGIDKRIAAYLWEDLQYCPHSGLERMIELSLLKIDDNNELRIHDHLRDLGRAIAHPVDKKPWDCSRLWGEEAIIVQRSKEENRNIEALRLDENGSRRFMKRQSFKGMPYLKLLHLSKVDFVGDFDDSLSELRWLEWKMCPNSFQATNVDLEKLVILDLSGGFISESWGGWSSIKMERLKVLNLSRCSKLKSTPNLSGFKRLEMLILRYCDSLEGFDPSIGDVKCLVSLNLRYCGKLKNLPKRLGELRKLEELLIDETDICSIPTCIEFLTELKMLSAVGCQKLTQVPNSISHLVNLSTLNLNTCKELHELPVQACRKLRRLLLAGCYKLTKIPFSIGEMRELVELDLSYTSIEELHKSIGKLKKLEILRISHSEIEKLPSAIGKLESLQELDASGCRKLEVEISVDKGGLSSLRTLCLGRAKISRLPEYFHELSTLEHLDLLHCSELESLAEPPSRLSSLQLTCLKDTLPSLSHLSHLKELTVHCCMSLRSIPALPPGIRTLQVWKCPKLERLSNLPNLISLLELELLQCYGLKELDGLEALISLRKLDVSTDTKPSNLDYEASEQLRHLEEQSSDGEADNLHEIPGLGQLESLEELSISARKHIAQLDLSKSEHMKQLIVNNCESLVDIRFHDRIKSLVRFDRGKCQPNITRLFST